MDAGGKRNRVLVNCRSRPYYDRRCKNNTSLSNLTNIESLPDELVFLILLELDAQEIYRRWYQMIRTHDFSHAQLQHSTPGLLIRWFSKRAYCPTFLTVRGGRIETFKLHFGFPGIYWNTCNGLMLGFYPGDGFNLCILNLATKQHFAVPPPPPDPRSAYTRSGIGYAPASMKYKVFRSHGEHGCAIFTVGVDTSWRNVDIQHVSDAASKCFYNTPLVIEGIVYWTRWNHTGLLSLNLESEIIREIHIPQGCEYGKYFLSTWSSLTLLVDSSLSGFSWDVWELKKPETGGEWRKLHNINLEPQKCRVEQLPYEKRPYPPFKPYLKPVGWLGYGEVLVLCVSNLTKVCLLYNVITQQTDFLELDHCTEKAECFLSYKNSLVRLDGCL